MASTDTTTEQDKTEAQRLLDEKFANKQKDLPLIEDKKIEGTLSEEDIEKNVPHKEWRFIADYSVATRSGEEIPQHFDRTYVQKPLSYIAMMEFTGLIGMKIDEIMSGPEGLSVDKMISSEGDLPLNIMGGEISLSRSDFDGVDSIVKGFAKLAAYAPSIVGEAQCIWLRVPRVERSRLMEIWALPPDEGGLPMKDGREMQNLFIEQNYEELESFLREWWSETRKSLERAKARTNRKGG